MSQIKFPEKKRGVVTLDSIVRSALMDIGAGMERYEQLKHWAIEAFRDFNFDLSKEIKTTQLSLTAWKAADLDTIPDFVDWVMIGVRINGELRSFVNNEDLALYFDDANTDGFPDVQPTNDDYVYDPTDETNRFGYWFWGLNSHGEDTGQMFGLTVKNNGVGYFRINKQRNEIQFNPGLSSDTKIYLEYISDGFDPGAVTVVNIYAAKLIKLYIHWQRLKFNKSSNQAQIESARRDYYVEYNMVQGRVNPITVDDVLEAARGGYKLTPSL